jgi:hypothetical protein
MPPMAHLPRDGFGPHGDRYLPWSIGLNLKRLMASEHGIDLGPLESGVSRRVLHRDRRVRLAAEPILSALTELETNCTASDGGLVLIGRRDLRSSNSWLHNIEALVSGRERCVLLVRRRETEPVQAKDGAWCVCTRPAPCLRRTWGFLIFQKLKFLRANEGGRSATPSRQRFDHPPPVFRRSTPEGSNFQAELSALKKECEVQSGAGSP